LIKCAKREESSFSLVADALNIPLSECLLIDDTRLNVEGAKAAGWQALLFSDATELQRNVNGLVRARNI
jgi:2-haloacid dehalogenase